MKKFQSNFLILIVLTFCAVFTIGIWNYVDSFSPVKSLISRFAKSDQNIQDKDSLAKLLKNAAEIQRIWVEGEDSREWKSLRENCLSYFGIKNHFDESLLRCHPLILQCLNQFSTSLDYNFLFPSAITTKSGISPKIYQYMTMNNASVVGVKNPGYLFTIADKNSGKKLDLFLSDQCHEVFLENRIYAYGEEVESEDYRFDNFNQNIYVDQHLVTNFDINNWIEFGNPEFTKELSARPSSEWFLPAVDLTMDQMMNYCSFKGSQLMTAHIFDAATFLPMDLANTTPKKNSRSPYYWIKKKSEFKADCKYIYANECLAKKEFELSSTAPTWSGLTDSMGGVFEAFRNPIDPDSNLKASSLYFTFKSPWHKLGFRAFWDGEGFDMRHFNFKGYNPIVTSNNFQVGFRCMRQSQ